MLLENKYSTTRLVRQVPASVLDAEIQAAHQPEDKFETVLFLPEGEGRKGEGGLRTQGYFKQSQEDKPLITVVTVVFNGEKFLEETILSVINQTYDNVEYIIIDGGSTDGTLDIIKKYEHAIDYWVSEKDKGIYDAMNKGIDLATGIYLQMLNSDDFLVENIYKQLNIIDFKEDVVAGSIKVINKQGFVKYISKASLRGICMDMTLNHPAIFLSRNVYKKFKFDVRYSISADYDYFINLIHKGFCFKVIDISIVFFREGGASSNFLKSRKEVFEIQKSRCGFATSFYVLMLSYFKKSIKTFFRI